jgi:hypothetical protein
MPEHHALDYLPDGYLHGAGAVVGVLMVLILVGIALAWAWGGRRRSLRRARQAGEALAGSSPLAVGATFVAGTVELAIDGPGAVRVEVDQSAREITGRDGRPLSHIWNETARRVVAHPFYLRHTSGERVRVEPGVQPLLIDTLDRTWYWQHDRRTLAAELTAGERAVVEGVVQRDADPEVRGGGAGYRDAARAGWVVRAPRADGCVSRRARWASITKRWRGPTRWRRP